MEVETWSIERPIPYARNPRKIPQAAVDKVAASIKAFGWRQPIVVDKAGVVVVGHTRLLAARKLGLSEVPVHIAGDLTDAEARAYRLADNRANEEASWDDELLRIELGDLGDISAELTAFDPSELERFGGEIGSNLADPEPQIDKAAELQAKWGTARGQAWEIGPHRLICGDCRDLAAVSRLWARSGHKIRLVWTDAPYGVDYAAKNAYLNRTDRGNRIQVPIENDKLTAGETGLMFKKALELAKGFAAPGAACYATVPGGPMVVYFISAMNEAGFRFRYSLVWVKQQFVLSMGDYHFRHEPILYGWLENGTHFFTDDRTQSSVFEVDKPHASEFHPTTKPVELIARMIANSSRKGELVYDPFCGSGSTLLAAHQLDRIGYGVEIDAGYAAVTLERLSAIGLKPQLIEEAGAK
jgi:DNA modification methylase